VRLPLAGAVALLSALALLAQQDGEQDPRATWLERLADDGREVRLADASGLDCAECHAQVTDEWRNSTHGTAWQDKHFQKELRKTRRKSRPKCMGCHAPPPMAPLGFPARPEARERNRHLGVDCRACHLGTDGETLVGPYGLETDAHPSTRGELFGASQASAACVACHATTIGPVIGIAQDFVDSGQAAEGRSCIECHMPELNGPIANDPAGEVTYPDRPRRSHRLNTPRDPEFLASAFGLSVEWLEGRADLRIENLAGHRVPGTTRRQLVFEVTLVDKHGDAVASVEQVIDHRRYLPVGGTLEVPLEGQGVKLVVVGEHDTDGMARPQVFVRREFPHE
jgi:cytochrome c554/c'-like protein